MPETTSSLLESFAALITEQEREDYLNRQPSLRSRESALALCEQATSESHQDLPAASQAADAALWLALKVGDPYTIGLAHRTTANILSGLARDSDAVMHYEQALALFQDIDDELQQAITRSSALPVLPNVHGPETALRWFELAKVVFGRRRDSLRLARLENNVATVFFRQENFQQALSHWQSAYEQLQAIGEPSDQAATLRNLAVCHIGLNNPNEARHYYKLARQLSEDHGFDYLLHAIDYNIAYLYYLEGDNYRALQLYQEARRRCRDFDDPLHEALCGLDESEIYLELNLLDEAASLAELSERQFLDLQRPYEAAKATFNRAVVDYRRGESHAALARLARAMVVFAREKNRLWPGQIELFRALIFLAEERHYEARRAARLALSSFRENGIPRRAALAQLVLAKVALAQGEIDEAAAACSEAMSRLDRMQEPQSLFPAFLLLAEIEDQRGSTATAVEALLRAEEMLVELRHRQPAGQVRLYGLREVLDVYEHLVFLLSREGEGQKNLVFEVMERAKTRAYEGYSSSDAKRGTVSSSMRSQLVDQVSALRRELDWLYRRLDHTELQSEPPAAKNLQELHAQSRAKEQELSRSLDRLRAKSEKTGAERLSLPSLSLEAARERLKNTALLSYFVAHDLVFCFVLTDAVGELLPIAVASTVRELQRQLWYHKRHSDHGETTAALRVVLEHLYDELLRPLEPQLGDRRLLIVPDKLLFLVPFHALRSGESYLAEQRAISYLPSVSNLPTPGKERPLQTESFLSLNSLENRGLPAAFSDSMMATVEIWTPSSESASRSLEDLLSTKWAGLHFSANVRSRPDNVLFSEFALGAARLTLLDLFRSPLSRLFTLEGGSFIPEVPGPSDDLAASWRVLLSAGVETAVLPIWPADLPAHRALLRRFYEELAHGSTAGEAYVTAMQAQIAQGLPLEAWAGLGLVGDPDLRLRGAQ